MKKLNYEKVIAKTSSRKIVADIDYRIIGVEDEMVIAVNHHQKLAVMTDFMEVDDFYLDSDYHQEIEEWFYQND